MKLKNLIFFYSSFTQKSGRPEFAFYVIFNITAYYFALNLYRTLNLENEKILNLFYTCLIILFTFVPMQAVISRRLRDLKANPNFMLFCFIPILNFAFLVFLLLAKSKND
ncbi:DUF805 domain-containing protein [Flavobacterium hungaricum]|uniref:DUF805 domain-containing protein n=1 Tax=Flavobacterium hungaricum TaxID=2082725 RepID=A0ABR9THF4_9FLAO|nr:DUF805 domain-containing protein [Flavobacterium hungaricum]